MSSLQTASSLYLSSSIASSAVVAQFVSALQRSASASGANSGPSSVDGTTGKLVGLYNALLEKEERMVQSPLERLLDTQNVSQEALLQQLTTSEINHGTNLSDLGRELASLGETLVTRALDWDMTTFADVAASVPVPAAVRSSSTNPGRRNAPPPPRTASQGPPPAVTSLNLPSPTQSYAPAQPSSVSLKSGKSIKSSSRRSGIFGSVFGKKSAGGSNAGSARYGEMMLESDAAPPLPANAPSVARPAINHLGSSSTIDTVASTLPASLIPVLEATPAPAPTRREETVTAGGLQAPLAILEPTPVAAPAPVLAPLTLPPPVESSPLFSDSSFDSPLSGFDSAAMAPPATSFAREEQVQVQEDADFALALSMQERERALEVQERSVANREREREALSASVTSSSQRREEKVRVKEDKARAKDEDKEKKKKRRESIIPSFGGGSLFKRGAKNGAGAGTILPDSEVEELDGDATVRARGSDSVSRGQDVDEFGAATFTAPAPLGRTTSSIAESLRDRNGSSRPSYSPQIPAKDDEVEALPLGERKKDKKRGFFARALSSTGTSSNSAPVQLRDDDNSPAAASNSRSAGEELAGASTSDRRATSEATGLVDAEGYSIKPVGYDSQPGMLGSKNLMDDESDEDGYGPPSPLPPPKVSAVVIAPAASSNQLSDSTTYPFPPTPRSLYAPTAVAVGDESAEDRLAALERIKGTLLASKSGAPSSPGLGSVSASSEVGEIGGVIAAPLARKSTTSRSNRRDVYKRETMLLATAPAAVAESPSAISTPTDPFGEENKEEVLAARAVPLPASVVTTPLATSALPPSSFAPSVPNLAFLSSAPPSVLQAPAAVPQRFQLERKEIVNAIYRNGELERLMVRGQVTLVKAGDVDVSGIPRSFTTSFAPSASSIVEGELTEGVDYVVKLVEETTAETKLLPNLEYLTSTSPATPTEYRLAPAAFAALATQDTVSILSYQVSGARRAPLNLKLAWKIDLDKHYVGIVLRYSPVAPAAGASPATVSNLAFHIPVDDAITSIQSKPFAGTRSGSEYTITAPNLALDDSAEETRLLVRLLSTADAAAGSTLFREEGSVRVSFTVQGSCLSGLEMDVIDPRESTVRVEQSTVAGRCVVYV